jgi:hypothetical protein
MSTLGRRTTLGAIALLPLLVAAAGVRGDGPARALPGRTAVTDAIRTDMAFASQSGDRARLAKGMKTCEERLATHPDDPEALVWHGVGLVTRSNDVMPNDVVQGMMILKQALDEMDRAVALAPTHLAFDNQSLALVPRSAALIQAAAGIMANAPDRGAERAHQMLLTSLAGYEQILGYQKGYWAQLSVHRRGELLAGLAEVLSRLNEKEKARVYLNRIVEELPGSPYEAPAKSWLAGQPAQLTCHGCHYYEQQAAK